MTSMLARTSLIQGRCRWSVRLESTVQAHRTHLVFLETVLENVLDHQATCLAQSDLMPHTTKRFVDVAHDLRWRIAPAELEKLLPDVAGIAMDHSLRNATEQLMHHGGFVLLRNAVERLLDDVTAEGVHAESKSVPTDGLSDGDDLLGRAMLKAALHEEVAETIDHERVGLSDDGFHNLVLLLRCADLELLLQEDGGLLIVVADDLIDDVLPIATHIAIEETPVVHRLDRRHVLRSTRFARRLQLFR